MKIGFSMEKDEHQQFRNVVSVNILTPAETETEFASSLENGEVAVGFLNLEHDSEHHTSLDGSYLKELDEALDAVHSLACVGHFNKGSICYALEHMLEEAFRAGQQFERKLQVETPTA